MLTEDKYRKYEIDHVYSEAALNREIYQHSTQKFVEKFMEGYNSSIFVYGQTGTGKSYTMGVLDHMNASSDGLIPNSVNFIFDKLRNDDRYQNASICISMVQVYKEDVYDLLKPKRAKLSVREDPETKSFFLPDLTIANIQKANQGFELINAGISGRAMAS